MIMAAAVLWIPLIGSFVAGLLSFFDLKRLASLGKIITCVCVGTSALIAADLAYDVIIKKQVVHGAMLSWISLGSHEVTWGLYVDSMSSIMAVVVTSVSLMVHIYSLGYMAQDKSIVRFMSYLSLFTFFMLFLVMSDDLLQLFLGWEGVGLASYLLIGFWWHKESASQASMKAFIVNRVGDAGMVLGIVGCFAIFGSVSMPEILSKLGAYKAVTIGIDGLIEVNGYAFICFCFLMGAMAKSAQFGLHVWLPDAMEGPTPVSALIHAATMVTAGVFLLVRMSFLLEYAPIIKSLILYIGAITALFAALVGLVQSDIKRVIAYSTCSQLGYMFMACGVGVYSAALFHLVTHAFFKALLFLGAGSVIHAMSHEQDMHKMGALYRKIPVTYALTWIGSLALAGIPFFAGFYSKDWILESLYLNTSGLAMLPYVFGVIAAFLTAFYSWRLIILVFHGESRSDEYVQAHIHEAPLSMLIPNMILAVGAVFSGWALQVFFTGESWIAGAYVYVATHEHVAWYIHWLPVFVAALGIGSAVMLYTRYLSAMQACSQNCNEFKTWLGSGMQIDRLYQRLVILPLLSCAKRVHQYLEQLFINRIVIQGIIHGVEDFGGRVRLIQNGRVGVYALMMVVGIVFVLGYMVWMYR